MDVKKHDEEILNYLLADSRKSLQSVAHDMGIPVTSAHDRFKRLIKAGAIKCFVSLLDFKFLRYGLPVLFLVKDFDYNSFDSEYVNSVIELRGDLFLIETVFSDIYELRNFRSSMKGYGKIERTLFVQERVKAFGFSF